MSSDDDALTRAHRHGLDVPETSEPFADVKQPDATWSTLQTALPADEVRQRLREGLIRFRAPFELLATKGGFVIRSTNKKPFIAEVDLSAWEEGTQLHISSSRDGGSNKKHVAALLTFLRSSLECVSRRT
jgi:hypothetical protein